MDKNGKAYDFQILKELQSQKDLKLVNAKFSLSKSKYIIIWKNDRTKIAKKEVDNLLNFVKKAIEKHMEKRENTKNESQIDVSCSLIPTKDYLIIAYDRMILPEGNINWKNYADMASLLVDDMIEE